MLPNYLKVLSEASAALLTTDDPLTLLDELYQQLAELIGLEVYLHYTITENGTQLRLAACRGIPDEDRKPLARLALGQAVCGTVAQRRTPLVISDVQTRSDEMTVCIRSLGITTYVCHPLIAQGRLLGTVSFGSRTGKALTEDALALVGIVASYVASALERRQWEQSFVVFNQRRRLYETALSNTPDLVYVFDLDHRFAYANESLLKLWGRTWDEAIGKTCLGLGYEPSHAAMHDREIDEVIATKRPIKGEVPYTGTQGRRFYQYIFVPILGTHGEVEAVAGTTRDITERVNAEAVRAHLAAIVDSSDDAIISTTLDGVMTTWNRAAERLFGYTAREAIGRHVSLIIPPERREEEPAILERIRQGERIEHFDTVRQKQNGMPVDVSLSVSPIIDDKGQIIGVSKSARDISDRKQTEAELKDLTADLEKRVADRTQALRQSRAKLRSLAAELTVTEERERRRIAEELHDHLAQLLVVSRMKLSHAIRQAANTSLSVLLHDIDHVIDSSLKYTRSLVVQLTPPVLHELGFQPALQWLASWMDQQGLKVSLRLSQQPAPLSEEQAILLYQSVRELLFNVLKHAATDRASITVTEEHERMLRVSVSDDGQGFDVNQAENTEPVHFGLFSIKERVESMHGTVEVRSSPGQGTSITILVPFATEAAVAKETFPKSLSNGDEAAHRVRILLVDDHAMVREGLRSILESYEDLEVIGEAGDGMEAVKLARTRHPDVVVMDINMPRMDGISATRQIKQDHPSTSVIGISVQESTQVEQAMLSAGASRFLTKDRAAGHLYEAILQTR